MMTRKALFGLLVLAFAGATQAGPPAICWPIDIGDAKSLAWGEGAKQRDERYDPDRAVADTLALLDASMPVLVRMETLRRATLYLDESRAGREALLRKLMVRILDAEAAGKPSPLAWFDAGYAVECVNQLRGEGGANGYPWVLRAIALAGGNPQMEYAGCLMTLMGTENRERFHAHLERAEAGAAKDPLLARNMESLKKQYPPVLRYFEQKEKKG
jgi:hypothetical protein